MPNSRQLLKPDDIVPLGCILWSDYGCPRQCPVHDGTDSEQRLPVLLTHCEEDSSKQKADVIHRLPAKAKPLRYSKVLEPEHTLLLQVHPPELPLRCKAVP